MVARYMVFSVDSRKLRKCSIRWDIARMAAALSGVKRKRVFF